MQKPRIYMPSLEPADAEFHGLAGVSGVAAEQPGETGAILSVGPADPRTSQRARRSTAADRMPSGNAGASVVVVDPSCFTLSYDYSLCNALVKHGCEVVLAQSEFRYADWDPPKSFTVWKHFYRRIQDHDDGASGHFWKLAKGAEHFFDMRSFVTEIVRHQPDIVHFQWLPVPILDQFYLSPLSRCSRLVLTLHNTSSFHGNWFARAHQKLGLARVLRYFDAIIVHTEFSRKVVLGKGWAAPEKVHVVPHGVFDYYRSFSPDETSPDRDLEVLFFGKIEPYKGLDTLLKAFAQLPQELRQRTRLVIAGRADGDVADLKQLSRSLGIEDRVRWDLRFIPETEVARLFRSAAVVALPYTDIDQSGVLMTAIGFEKPIVGTRVGGIPETIQDGVHGVLVNPGDTAGLAQALDQLLSDPDRRRSMQAALHGLRIGPLSWDRTASDSIEIYHHLLR